MTGVQTCALPISPELSSFADRMEKASISTIESGIMTKDLYGLAKKSGKRAVNTVDFLKEIASRL